MKSDCGDPIAAAYMYSYQGTNSNVEPLRSVTKYSKLIALRTALALCLRYMLLEVGYLYFVPGTIVPVRRDLQFYSTEVAYSMFEFVLSGIIISSAIYQI